MAVLRYSYYHGEQCYDDETKAKDPGIQGHVGIFGNRIYPKTYPN